MLLWRIAQTESLAGWGVRCLIPGTFSRDMSPLCDVVGRTSPEKIRAVSNLTPHQASTSCRTPRRCRRWVLNQVQDDVMQQPGVMPGLTRHPASWGRDTCMPDLIRHPRVPEMVLNQVQDDVVPRPGTSCRA